MIRALFAIEQSERRRFRSSKRYPHRARLQQLVLQHLYCRTVLKQFLRTLGAGESAYTFCEPADEVLRAHHNGNTAGSLEKRLIGRHQPGCLMATAESRCHHHYYCYSCCHASLREQGFGVRDRSTSSGAYPRTQPPPKQTRHMTCAGCPAGQIAQTANIGAVKKLSIPNRSDIAVFPNFEPGKQYPI